jgi:hypothetical protein
VLLPTLLGLTACLLIGMIVSRNRWARVFGVVLAIPLALLTYGVIGLAIARVIGVGRFYSVPFGAEHIKDWHILASLATWISVWAVLIPWSLGRPHSRIPPSTPSAKLLHSNSNMLEQPAAFPGPPDPIDKPPPDIKPVPPPDIPPPAGEPDVQPPPGPPERGSGSPVI